MAGIVFIVHINEIHSILKVTFDLSSSTMYFSYDHKDVRIWKDNSGYVFCVRTCAVGLKHIGMCVCIYTFIYTQSENVSNSVVSDSVRPHGPTRLLCP